MGLTDAVLLDYQERAVWSKCNPRHLSDLGGRLGNDLDRWDVVALRPHDSLKTRFFLWCANMPAAFGELSFQLVVDGKMGCDRIVSKATSRVIKGLGISDHLRGIVNVRGLVDNVHRVPNSNTISRCSRTIGCFHHAGAARRNDQIAHAH